MVSIIAHKIQNVIVTTPKIMVYLNFIISKWYWNLFVLFIFTQKLMSPHPPPPVSAVFDVLNNMWSTENHKRGLL